MQLKHLLIRLYEKISSNSKMFVFVPLIFYWFTIFVLTTWPSPEFPPVLAIGDKIQHFLAYFVLGSILFFALHFQERFPMFRKRIFLSAIAICYLYGIFDEIHQIFIPGRSFDWFDLLANYTGSYLGVSVSYIYLKFIKETTVSKFQQLEQKS